MRLGVKPCNERSQSHLGCFKAHSPRGRHVGKSESRLTVTESSFTVFGRQFWCVHEGQSPDDIIVDNSDVRDRENKARPSVCIIELQSMQTSDRHHYFKSPFTVFLRE